MAVHKSSSIQASRILLWTIVIITVISMAIPTLMKFRPLGSSSITVMTLNDQDITRAQVTRRYDMLRNQIMMLQQQLAQQGTGLDVAALYNQSKEIAIQSIVHETLLDEVTRKACIVISADYVAQKLADPMFVMQELAEFIPPYFIMQRGSLDMNMLPNMLRERGSSMQEFERFVENAIGRQTFRALLNAGTAVPEFLRNSACQQRYAKKQFSLLSLNLSQIKKEMEKTAPTKAELREFFDAHSAQYHIPEKRSGIIYTFKTAAYDIAIAEAEIESYYQDHKRDYIKEPAKVEIRALLVDPTQEQKAREIQALLQAQPQSWDEIAQKQGLKNISKTVQRTDEQGWATVAFNLKQDNEIAADLIRTPEGIAIVQRVRRVSPTYKPVKAVAEEIKKNLRAQKFEQMVTADIARLRASEDKAAAVAQMAKTKNADKKVVTSSEVTDNSSLKKLFATPVGEIGTTRENNELIVVTTTAIEPRHAASFDTIKDQIEKDWYLVRAQDRLQQLLKEIKGALENMPVADVAKKYHLGLITSPLASIESSNDALKKMREAGVTNDALVYLYRPGATLVYDDATHGYILRLDAIEQVDCTPAEKASLQKELTEQMQNAATSGFVASLYKGAKITNNQQMPGFAE